MTKDFDFVVSAYVEFLHLTVVEEGTLSTDFVEMVAAPDLIDHRFAVLANTKGHAWLRIIEDTHAQRPSPLKSTGWIALEVLVEDVDTLARSLEGSPFKQLRPVANLEMSDLIRAVQIEGPAGEVLYLTQIKAEVPPFKLPLATCAVDHLFIPILASHDRQKTLEIYEDLSQTNGMSFDTKITVINQIYGYDLDQQHPVAVIQLAGNTLVEIDEIPSAEPPKRSQRRMPAGIAMISFAQAKLPQGNAPLFDVSGAAYAPKSKACVISGASGELIELVSV
ncbi:hypothetical protein QGN29_03845 [Temperatibacter marinus]|uniref:VOC domain-containing protein n=1 Tax=Temperatibacter marinus TaxID=1456591 RepID=A0AA52HA15_9PROT|nr:hypothetical protein [Temperatibacter marinus]WND03504.1 hypothetical protein QGN29_03845 [Temperatibacter marinus]